MPSSRCSSLYALQYYYFFQISLLIPPPHDAVMLAMFIWTFRSLGRPPRDSSDGSGDSIFERAMSARLGRQAAPQMSQVKTELSE